ncbi:sensor histidine kinase [Limosilactobacillus pontis]|uniref:histidine kinase n=1 Tax=Limosilactobacillus pontis TaxID=35787 RepID=A0ABT7UX07_9LACO|nr:sensor histidine kinase [Limosilactobacillus pontis]MDM8266219.1 sensor histidine kinase [Limosilactobacillus pontis]
MNSRFWRLLVRATLPIFIAYLLLVGLAWLLAILYQLPQQFCWDLIRFSLPVLLVWLGIIGLRNWQRVRRLQHHNVSVALHNPVEGQLLDQLQRAQTDSDRHVRALRLQQQEQLDNLDLFAHEIKNSLTSLKAAAENVPIVASTTVKEEVREANYYLDLLLNDERLTMASNDYEFSWVNLADLVNTIIQQNSALFIRRQLVPDLVSFDHCVLTDPKWLRFCINQLLSNAIKYSSPGGTITIAWHVHALIVSDQGMGISPADQQRIFENGFTGHNGHQTTQSTGMGLYLVKRITDKLNFTIRVHSKVGQGSSFSLIFPAGNTR